MGFGPFFMTWIILIYSTQEAEIVLDGCKSRSFPLSRGCDRKLSFNIVIETLAIMVRKQENNIGLHVSTSMHNILLFADDSLHIMRSREFLKGSRGAIGTF